MVDRVGQQESLKTINRTRVFDELRRKRSISRADLARRTHLSRTTLSILADELLAAGVARETGFGTSTGGRPPVMLQFQPEAALALGARMRDHQWGIAATDLDAEIQFELTVPVHGNSPEDSVRALNAGVAAIREEIDNQKVLPAIGLGTPGLVDMRSGVIKTAVDMDWFDVPMKAMVEDALGIQTYVANRSRVGALVELWRSAEEGIQDLIYISIGTGVAAGIVHEGKLYIGANSSAGELGHVTILPDGPLCPCGNRGCLQQLVSGPSIANQAREKLRHGNDSILLDAVGYHPERLTSEIIFAAAAEGDSIAQEVVDGVAEYLGIALGNLVNLFNPELIVLGGPVGQIGDVLVEPLVNEVRKRAMAYPLSVTQIRSSLLGASTGTAGAATLVLQRASELIFQAKTTVGI